MADEFRDRVGQAIRARRHEIKMGPMDFAAAMHVNVKTTERWERGETDGALRLLDQIASVLETDTLALTCFNEETYEETAGTLHPLEDRLQALEEDNQLDRIERLLLDLRERLTPAGDGQQGHHQQPA